MASVQNTAPSQNFDYSGSSRAAWPAHARRKDNKATSRAPFRSTRIRPSRKLSFDPNRKIGARTQGVAFRGRGVIFRDRGVVFTNKLVDNIWAQFGLKRSSSGKQKASRIKAERAAKTGKKIVGKAKKAAEMYEPDVEIHAPAWATSAASAPSWSDEEEEVVQEYDDGSIATWELEDHSRKTSTWNEEAVAEKAAREEAERQRRAAEQEAGRKRKAAQAEADRLKRAQQKQQAAAVQQQVSQQQQQATDPKSYNMYAIQMFKAGKLDEAKYWFEQALAIDPNYDPAIQNYKVVLEQLRERGK